MRGRISLFQVLALLASMATTADSCKSQLSGLIPGLGGDDSEGSSGGLFGNLLGGR